VAGFATKDTVGQQETAPSFDFAQDDKRLRLG